MFDIGFDARSKRIVRNGEPVRRAYITLGSFTERLVVPVEYWSELDYRRSWRDALAHITGQASSCLITGLRNPVHTRFVEWWPMYREGNHIFVQNHLLFLDDIDGSFDPVHPYERVPHRETVSDEGEPISEWEIGLDDVLTFLNQGH